MSKLLESINQHTQMAGENRLELLLFRLNGPQLYGINVFKVKRIVPTPQMIQLPDHHPCIAGIADTMDGTLPIINLNTALRRPEVQSHFDTVIVTEFNHHLQGFMVEAVEHIINLDWPAIQRPPHSTGRHHYLTAITEYDNKIVEIIDVEKIMDEISPKASSAIIEASLPDDAQNPQKILVVDDSQVARQQIKRSLTAIGFEAVMMEDGKEALQHLRKLVDEGHSPIKEYLMVISDIEMPQMDGYALTRAIKETPALAELHVLLHTSLSGIFNKPMVQAVGADDFIAKFDPTSLAQAILEQAGHSPPCVEADAAS